MARVKEAKRRLILGTHGSGLLHSMELDPASGTLTETSRINLCERPGWQVQHPVHREIVYSTSHTDQTIFQLRVNADGSMIVQDRIRLPGSNPVHMAVVLDPPALVVANYGHDSPGNVITLRLSPTGDFLQVEPLCFDPPCSDHIRAHPRQQQPHPHQVLLHDDRIYVPDLGSNKVWVMDWFDGRLELSWEIEGFREGDGPRNAVVHPSGEYIYVLNEISNTLTVHSLSPDLQSAKLLDRLSILPAPTSPFQPSSASSPAPPSHQKIAGMIQFIPHTNTILCTNRNSPEERGDAIAFFSVDPSGFPVQQPTFVFPGMRHIRALSTDEQGRYTFTAGRDGGGCMVWDNETGEEVARSRLDCVISALWLAD